MSINAAWHRAHRMPKNATLEERLAWHAAHSKACDCREMPASIAREIARRRRKARSRGAATSIPRRGRKIRRYVQT